MGGLFKKKKAAPTALVKAETPAATPAAEGTGLEPTAVTATGQPQATETPTGEQTTTTAPQVKKTPEQIAQETNEAFYEKERLRKLENRRIEGQKRRKKYEKEVGEKVAARRKKVRLLLL